METTDNYLPVDPIFFDVIESAKTIDKESVVNYFESGSSVSGTKGKITGVHSPDGFSQFMEITGHHPVRIDRIITLNGKPGPAFDEYDRYALECLTCKGGMD